MLCVDLAVAKALLNGGSVQREFRAERCPLWTTRRRWSVAENRETVTSTLSSKRKSVPAADASAHSQPARRPAYVTATTIPGQGPVITIRQRSTSQAHQSCTVRARESTTKSFRVRRRRAAATGRSGSTIIAAAHGTAGTHRRPGAVRQVPQLVDYHCAHETSFCHLRRRQRFRQKQGSVNQTFGTQEQGTTLRHRWTGAAGVSSGGKRAQETGVNVSAAAFFPVRQGASRGRH